MEIKTCEEYVLAELADMKAAAARGKEAEDVLAALKQIFYVEDTEDGTGINIGVRDELFDTEHDPSAVGRIMLLRSVFGVGVSAGNAGAGGGQVAPVGPGAGAAEPAEVPAEKPADTRYDAREYMQAEDLTVQG